MNEHPYKPGKLFTIDEANATLPLVKIITSDLVRLSRDVVERRERLDQLAGGRDRDAVDVYSEELEQVHRDLEKDSKRLQGYVEELRQIGVEPKTATTGLVDFPSMQDEHLVFLCWKLGESEVLHWHELDAGFAGRQPLTVGSVADSSSISDESLGG